MRRVLRLCAEFSSFRPDAAVTSSCVIFTVIKSEGVRWGGQAVQNICKQFTVTSLFNVRQLNPKHLVKFGEWVLPSWTMSSVEALTNALRHSEWNCSWRVSNLWLKFKAHYLKRSCGWKAVLLVLVCHLRYYIEILRIILFGGSTPVPHEVTWLSDYQHIKWKAGALHTRSALI